VYSGHEILSDIASDINFKGRSFLRLLEGAFCRDIEEIVITHRDRLCRFCYELVDFGSSAKLDQYSRLVRTNLRQFCLNVPKALEIRLENQNLVFRNVEELRKARAVTSDPGMRTFRTCFHPLKALPFLNGIS
jgi:hypothetical protein